VNSEPLTDFAEHQPVGDTPLPPYPWRRRLAVLVCRGPKRAHQQRPIPDHTTRAADLIHFSANPSEHLFPEARHGGEIGWPHFAHHLPHLVDVGTEIDLAAGTELAQMADDALENMRQRKIRHHSIVGVASETF